MLAPPQHGAITYLCQVRHSSYTGRDSLALLQESLALLHKHYNDQPFAQHDVLLFHSGDYGEAEQNRVLAPYRGRGTRAHVRFEQVPSEHWRLPLHVAPHLGGPTVNRTRDWAQYPQYSEGYRHMCRWYTIGLWETLERLGYGWVMRLDEDSRLLSEVPYNLFGYMRSHGLLFGYRMVSYESGYDGERFHAFVRSYLLAEQRRAPAFRPQWLLDGCGANATSRDFSHHRCGEVFGFYNNFFVSSVAFWRSGPVQRLLSHIDKSGYIYTRRYGDLLLQSVCIQIHLPRTRVHLFREFTYEHSTRVSRVDFERRFGHGEHRPLAAGHQSHSPPQLGASQGVSQGVSQGTSQGVSQGAASAAVGGGGEGGAAPLPPGAHDLAMNASAPPHECIAFGGYAAGLLDPYGYRTVLGAVRAGAFCRPPCIRVLLHRRRLVIAATAGQVKVEQHDCTRSPPPYYCFAGGSTVADLAVPSAELPMVEPPAGEPLQAWSQAKGRRGKAKGGGAKGSGGKAKGGGGKGSGAKGGGKAKGGGGKGGSGTGRGGKHGGSDWKDRIALDADTARDPDSAYARALAAWDAARFAAAAKDDARAVFGPGSALAPPGGGSGATVQAMLALNLTARWSDAALRASPLGTCALPPSVARSKCGDVVRAIRAHPSAHNVRSGIRYGCPSSIHRYLVACRPEAT